MIQKIHQFIYLLFENFLNLNMFVSIWTFGIKEQQGNV